MLKINLTQRSRFEQSCLLDQPIKYINTNSTALKDNLTLLTIAVFLQSLQLLAQKVSVVDFILRQVMNRICLYCCYHVSWQGPYYSVIRYSIIYGFFWPAPCKMKRKGENGMGLGWGRTDWYQNKQTQISQCKVDQSKTIISECKELFIIVDGWSSNVYKLRNGYPTQSLSI